MRLFLGTVATEHRIRSVFHRAWNGAPADWGPLSPSPDSSLFGWSCSAAFSARPKKLRDLSVSSDSHPAYVDYLSGFETQSGCLFSALAVSVSGGCLFCGLFDFPLLVRADESLDSVLAEATCIFSGGD